MPDIILEETIVEVVVGALARAGIISAHAFEFIGDYHTVVIVAGLWSLEEVVGIRVAVRRMVHHRHEHKGTCRKGHTLEAKAIHALSRHMDWRMK